MDLFGVCIKAVCQGSIVINQPATVALHSVPLAVKAFKYYASMFHTILIYYPLSSSLRATNRLGNILSTVESRCVLLIGLFSHSRHWILLRYVRTGVQ